MITACNKKEQEKRVEVSLRDGKYPSGLVFLNLSHFCITLQFKPDLSTPLIIYFVFSVVCLNYLTSYTFKCLPEIGGNHKKKYGSTIPNPKTSGPDGFQNSEIHTRLKQNRAHTPPRPHPGFNTSMLGQHTLSTFAVRFQKGYQESPVCLSTDVTRFMKKSSMFREFWGLEYHIRHYELVQRQQIRMIRFQLATWHA